MDLKLTGRTYLELMAPKGQELEDHYFGSLKRKVAAFMKDLDAELWKYGIPSKQNIMKLHQHNMKLLVFMQK